MDKDKMVKLVIIGATAFDEKEFYDGKVRKDIGGACIYASVSASIFHRVAIVTKVGQDFPLNAIKNLDINLDGLQVIENEKTTAFQTKFLSADGKRREINGDISDSMTISFRDIPKSFLDAAYFYITTMEPAQALPLVKEIKNNSSAKIAFDTIKPLVDNPMTREVFDLVDIAFLDQEFKTLMDCKAKTKIIKLGKTGCIYDDGETTFRTSVKTKDHVVDKAGAGDCLNGTFMCLLSYGVEPQEALEVACRTATTSIDDYGILTLPDRISSR